MMETKKYLKFVQEKLQEVIDQDVYKRQGRLQRDCTADSGIRDCGGHG